MFFQPPNLFWCTMFPRHVLPTLDFHSLASHTSRLYDIPGQPPLHLIFNPTHYHLFSFSHISEVVRVMNNNITPDEEGFQDKFFKLGISILGPFLTMLFNWVVCVGFPDSWSWHIIYLIHKFGPTSDLENYKTNMVGHTFTKLYVTMLNDILSSELDQINC